MVTPDTHSRIELIRFLNPPILSDHRRAAVNSLGYQCIMFTVADIEEMVTRLTKKGAQLVGQVVQYEHAYRLCYMRGTEKILIGLAEPINKKKGNSSHGSCCLFIRLAISKLS